MNKINPKKNSYKVSKKYYKIGFLIYSLPIWLILFIMALIGYTGSKVSYTIFSIVTGVMLIDGLGKKTSYGYKFLTVFLWLGFWLKMTLHTILDYPFVEPVGSFVGGSKAWDQVLYTATIACLGVILGRLIYNKIIYFFDIVPDDEKIVVPFWYAPNRKWLWGGLFSIAIFVIYVNYKYGIHQIGLVPRTILMWPLNAVVAWLLNIGLATGVAVMLWWDILLKKNITIPIYAIIVEALVSSVSILSRAAYVFHTIPLLWAASRFKHNFKDWSIAKTNLLLIIFTFLLVISVSLVTTFRNILYQSGSYLNIDFQEASSRSKEMESEVNSIKLKIKESSSEERKVLENNLYELMAKKKKFDLILTQEEKSIAAIEHKSVQAKVLLNEFGYQIAGGSAALILQLSVDRWIGLEGLMAVQSYPGKNMQLLFRALNEKPEVGEPDIYQTIANSIYLKADGTKFLFATLPGAAALLYYSGSLFVVLIGMATFSLAIFAIERVIYILTTNPILCSLYGAVIAGNIAQFGGSPRLNLPYFFVLTCGILLVWIVQSKFFTQILCMLKLVRIAHSNND